MNIVLLGAPGAGKGTQAEKISMHLQLSHISTGEILRDAVEKKTTLGVKAKSYMDQGDLVPDDIMISLIKEVLPENKDFLLDGFPRTLDQAIALDQSLDKEGKAIHLAINLDVSRELLMVRMEKRGRSDDNRQTIERRLDNYDKQTLPLIEYYKSQGKLKSVDGNQIIGVVENSILELLEAR